MFFWSEKQAVKLTLSSPANRPFNAFMEILGGKLRNERLNQNWFRSTEEA